MTFIPDPTALHPLPHADRVVLLKPLVTTPKIEVGEYTYYDDPEHATGFETRNVLYGYGPEKLVIGRFCALAAGTTFIMAGANHLTTGVSTFPFTIFGGAWQDRTLDLVTGIGTRGDTVVGNDVWFGYDSLVMPGVSIGDGAIVAAGSVVVSDVPPYAVVGGNPARVLKLRFPEDDVARLLRARWWDWPVELITEHARVIMAGTPADVERVAADNGLW
ncbi:CatB-related O-acetyltransferase [Saccharothrix syringae]|uniref:CatB-related O-acetyltransferase n=1 Tax=Saccharothrix syringae TaxID=103733 RepID=A0A5Q0H8Z3_SACSY|nr:CatB-related O-acetyltransferase [Saccharothrix syringae]QFZ22697.1 CatB-related O-acetyltransferase [Saccharothrix syringae]